MKTTETHHLAELGYTVVVEYEERPEGDGAPVVVEFRVYRITGESLDGRPGPVWELEGSDTGEPTDDLAAAQVFLHGDVKWDGCSNWLFDEQEHVMLHFCERKAAESVGKLLGWCYEKAGEITGYGDDEDFRSG